MRRRIWLGLGAAIAGLFPMAGSHAGVAPVADQRLGVLASFFPSERDYPGSYRPMWDRLAATGTDTGLVATVELATSSIDYMDFVSREQRLGQKVLATVAAGSESAMLGSASFQRSTYGFDGVLLRGYSGVCDETQPSAALLQSLRALGFTTIATQTSSQPGSCFATSDVLLNFEGSVSAYGAVVAPAWLSGPTPRIWHVVYDVAQTDVAAVVAASKAKGADYVMASPDAGPIESSIIPARSYLDSLRSAVRNGAPSGAPDERWPAVRRPGSVIPAFGAAYPGWSSVHPLPAAPFGVVVINPVSGPGLSTDPGLATQVAALHSSGRSVLGYLTAGYLPGTARTVDDVVADAIRYRSLYDVDGVFIDEVRPECTTASSYAAIASRLRSAGVGQIVFNPGRNTGECFAPHFDAIVNFEGPMSSYRTWTPSTWTGRYAPSKFWHLVHTTDPSEIAEAVALSRGRQAGRVYVTTLPGASAWTSTLSPQHLAAHAGAIATPRDGATGGSGVTPPARVATGASGPAVAPGGPRARTAAPTAA